MHRFFLDSAAGFPPPAAGDDPSALDPGAVVELTGSDAEHIARVLRLARGDRIVVCDGQGSDYEAELLTVNPARVAARVLSRQPSRGEPPVFLTIVQGIPKGDKMDLVVQKAVEAGASRIVPVFTARTVVVWDEAKSETRWRRWQRIAYEAAKQAHRGRVPQVAPPVSLPAFLAARGEEEDDFGHVIVPWEEARGRGLRAVLRGLSPGPVTVLIGPEGGLSPEEVAAAEERGAHIVTLGPRILRTETAGLVAATIILYEWGDLGGLAPGSSA